MYEKWEYTAVEVWDSNYFHIYYNWKPMMSMWNHRPAFSLHFILAMWFTEIN